MRPENNEEAILKMAVESNGIGNRLALTCRKPYDKKYVCSPTHTQEN